MELIQLIAVVVGSSIIGSLAYNLGFQAGRCSARLTDVDNAMDNLRQVSQQYRTKYQEYTDARKNLNENGEVEVSL